MFNRETLPSITTLESICHAYGITISDFFAEESQDSLIHSDKEVLSLYHTLNGEAKSIVLALLRELSKR